MKSKRLIWQIFPSFVIVILLSLASLTWFSSRSIEKFYLETTHQNLVTRAVLLETKIHDLLIKKKYEEIDSLCKVLGTEISTRFTIVLKSGQVVADSEKKTG